MPSSPQNTSGTDRDAHDGVPTTTDAQPEGQNSSRTADPPLGRGLSSPHAWVTSTNFSEGFFYGIVHTLSEILFASLGASLSAIGLTSLFHLPWNLKFTWGPLVDRYETKRTIVIFTQVALALLALALAAAVALNAPLEALAFLFVATAFFAATHDIAVDGYYLEALNKADAARFVGYRASSFRGATLLLGGPFLALIALISWETGLVIVAVCAALLALYHAIFLPRVETRKESWLSGLRHLRRPTVLVFLGIAASLGAIEWSSGAVHRAWDALTAWRTSLPIVGKLSGTEWVVAGLLTLLALGASQVPRARRLLTKSDGPIARSYLSFIEQPQVGRILAFIVLFRLGESLVSKMRWPFLKDVCAYELVDYSLVNGTIGVAASMVAMLGGGWIIARHGLRRWLLPFMVAQNGLNWLFFGLATLAEPSSVSRFAIAAVLTADNFASGLGTAAFSVYMMRCARPEYRGGHMAIITSIMSVGWAVAGSASGVLAQSMGFANYFAMSFLVTIPSMVLALFVPHLEEKTGPGQAV